MDKDERLAIKKKILAMSQTKNSGIPSLSYSNIEIIDPEPVDETLIQEIDEDNPYMPLTDELFFECIQGSIDYLAYEPFRNKIKQWQATLNNPASSKEEKEAAKDKMSQISKNLLKLIDGRGRPKEFEKHESLFYKRYKDLTEKLEPFLNEVKGLTPHKKRLLFKERFPESSEYASEFSKHRSASEIAKAIIVKQEGISKRSLNNMLKIGKETIERTRPLHSKRRLKK